MNLELSRSAAAIYHGDGYSFTQVPSPTSYNLYAIWGSGPRDIWAVGEGGIILHYGQ